MRCCRSFKFWVLSVSLFVGLSSLISRAEDKTAPSEDSLRKIEEVTSQAPDTTDSLRMAMDDFHQVMAPLWHEAFSAKDFKTIREKAPLLQEKLLALLKVKLPTYLQEDEQKLNTFLSKRQELAYYVGQVSLASKDGVDSTLASAFEQMHWTYEELEKVFAVPIPELDSFHETLYFLWHKALPGKDYKAIKETASILKVEMDTLMKVPLPYGCAKKKEEFEKRKSALKDAVYGLVDVCQKGEEKKIEEALSLVHERFVELNQFLR